MPHYVTFSLNNISAFSFPATANQQPTGGTNGNDGVDVDASASSSSAPVQEEQGEEIDQHEETGNSYEHFVPKNR